MKTLTIKIEQETGKVVSGTIKLYESRKKVGYVAYILTKDKHLKLLNLQIEKPFRLKGYGTLLVNVARGLAKGYKCKKIVLLSLDEAVLFWEKMGFKEKNSGLGLHYMEYEIKND